MINKLNRSIIKLIFQPTCIYTWICQVYIQQMTQTCTIPEVGIWMKFTPRRNEASAYPHMQGHSLPWGKKGGRLGIPKKSKSLGPQICLCIIYIKVKLFLIWMFSLVVSCYFRILLTKRPNNYFYFISLIIIYTCSFITIITRIKKAKKYNLFITAGNP